MALERLLSFKERKTMLKALMDLNSSAEQAYNTAVKEGRPISECYKVAWGILKEAANLADGLSWYPRITIKRDSQNGLTRFYLSDSGSHFVQGYQGDTAVTTCDPFDMIRSGDVLHFKAAALPGNRGEMIVDNVVGTFQVFLSGTPLEMDSDDELLEIELGYFDDSLHSDGE